MALNFDDVNGRIRSLPVSSPPLPWLMHTFPMPPSGS